MANMYKFSRDGEEDIMVEQDSVLRAMEDFVKPRSQDYDHVRMTLSLSDPAFGVLTFNPDGEEVMWDCELVESV
jgi:hypothetical protein